MSDFFLQGVMHPLVMPAHLILLIALGLLAGQQSVRAVTAGCITLVLSLAAACMATVQFRLSLEPEVALLLSAVVAGGLVALRLSLPTWPILLLALIAGLLIGLDSSAPRIPGLRGDKVHALLAGTVLSASITALVCALFALMVRNLLEGIVLRVLGAWITAGALLVLALYVVRGNLI